MNNRKRQTYLQAMGIQAWNLRHPAAVSHAKKGTQTAKTTVSLLSEPKTASAWEKLQLEVRQCQRCDLHRTRTQTVFGVGKLQAELLIIGIAPNATEDLQGEPGVGRAGKLLNAMLRTIGLQRETVFITHILKSHPPADREPKAEELAACLPFLTQQIGLIKPKLILAIGQFAAQYLLNTQAKMATLRGREFNYGPNASPLVVTYHPEYLLQAPQEKRQAWLDWQFVAQKLAQLKV